MTKLLEKAVIAEVFDHPEGNPGQVEKTFKLWKAGRSMFATYNIVSYIVVRN